MVLMAGVLVAATLAPAASRPVCDKANRGTMWPADAKSKEAVLCQPLEICVGRLLGYRWETIRVPYWQLTGQAAPEACQTAVESSSGR